MAVKMWCVLLMCVAALAVDGRTLVQEGSCEKSLNVKTFHSRSPPLKAKPGEVNNKYFPTQVPLGHIGIKGFTAEIVDESGASIPLSEMYLHHWVMAEFSVPKDKAQRHLGHLLRHTLRHHKHGIYYDVTSSAALEAPSHHHKLHETRYRRRKFPKFVNFFGKGGETRHTETRLPGPYVIESGIPVEGHESVWMLNVHGLDTRGAISGTGCAECRCNLFNATVDEDGKPLPEGYIGGLLCCGDGNMCALEEGYNGEERTFHLKYTIDYVDWSECVVPTTSVAIDITNHDGYDENLIEFTVEGCGDADPDSEECVDRREATLISPLGGEMVFAVSHLHASTLDAAIYGEDGRLICQTTPMYGQGHEAGNEKHYVVGIKHCVGNPGSPNAQRVQQGEKLRYVVTSTKVGGPHTGLMGLATIRIVPDGVSAVI